MRRLRTVPGMVLLLLAGCGGSGSGDGSIEPGIEAAMSVTAAKSARNQSAPSSDEAQTFYTDAGKRIDLENGFLVLAPVSLVACSSTGAALGRWLLDAIVPRAQAHGSGVEAPAGVLDVVAADGVPLVLGRLPAAPGNYCGLRIELRTLPASAPGGADGARLYVAPCYYPQSGTIPDIPGADPQPDEIEHACYQLPVGGAVSAVTLDFAAPLRLGDGARHADIGLLVEYDTWFDGVDVEALAAGDAAQAQKLLDNVAASVQLL